MELHLSSMPATGAVGALREQLEELDLSQADCLSLVELLQERADQQASWTTVSKQLGGCVLHAVVWTCTVRVVVFHLRLVLFGVKNRVEHSATSTWTLFFLHCRHVCVMLECLLELLLLLVSWACSTLPCYIIVCMFVAYFECTERIQGPR